MALFESYERRIDKINGVLAQYGISSVEECREICQAKGFDPYEIVKGIQPICFENACWAYTVGAAIALKKGVKTAAEAAEAIGIGLQAFCIDGSVAEDRKVGLGHGNLGAMLLRDETKCFAFLAGHESFAAAEGAIGIARSANKARKEPLRQQHHLAELLLGQANELLRLFRQHILFGIVKKGDQDPMVVDFPGGILLRQLHPLGHQPPGELIALSPDGEPEGDNGGLAACRLVAAPLLQIVAAHLALAVVAAAAAVEGEGHGVKNRGLAAARRALNEEHSLFRQLFKVHGLHLHIGPEGLHFQL